MLGVINWNAVSQATNTISSAATTAANIYTQVKSPYSGGAVTPQQQAVQNAANIPDPTKKSNTTTYLVVGGIGAAALVGGLIWYNKKKKKKAA